MSAKSACVYRHYNKDGALLYVGVSICVLSRTASHRHAAPWFSEIHTIKVEHYDTYSLAADAETAAILAEQPIHNKRGKALPKKPVRKCVSLPPLPPFVSPMELQPFETWSDTERRKYKRLGFWGRAVVFHSRDPIATIAKSEKISEHMVCFIKNEPVSRDRK